MVTSDFGVVLNQNKPFNPSDSFFSPCALVQQKTWRGQHTCASYQNMPTFFSQQVFGFCVTRDVLFPRVLFSVQGSGAYAICALRQFYPPIQLIHVLRIMENVIRHLQDTLPNDNLKSFFLYRSRSPKMSHPGALLSRPLPPQWVGAFENDEQQWFDHIHGSLGPLCGPL